MRAALLISAALIVSPAYAQTATNTQLQLRGVTALTDVEVARAGDVGISALASGNSVTGASNGVDADYVSDQHMDGASRATTNATVWHATGVIAASSTAAGNGLTAQTSGGDLALRSDQRAHNDVSAETRFTGGDAGDASTSASSSGNVAAIAAENGDLRVILAQESDGAVRASAEADHCCVAGQAVSGAIASANNATLAGTTTTNLSDTAQSARGAVAARVDLYAGYATDASGNATGNGNALTIDNQWGYANGRARQQSSADVSADAYVTLGGDFLGFASAGAYGVGNSVTASNVGSDMALDVAQENSGDVSATAAMAGTGGVTALASSAAYGNSVSAALCAYCDSSRPTLTAANSQTNDGDVRSEGVLRTPNAQSVGASAAAIGNAATFQSTGPGGR